jgi:phage host-nuclease inhibitor protein Gam
LTPESFNKRKEYNMTRIKPVTTAPLIKSLEEADTVLGQIAALRRNISLIETGLNEDIDAAKARAAAEADPYKQEIAGLEQALARFAEYHKSELFTKRKSCDLTFGAIGFRASSKIKLLSKMTWERVLQTLRDTGMRHCIRMREEPDKEALKALAPDHLKELGCKVVQEDSFFYEIADQELSPGAGEAA